MAAERIPPDSIIVVVPTRVPPWLTVPDDTLRALDSLIVARFAATGQPVLKPQAYTAVWDSVLSQYDGIRLAEAGPIPPGRLERAQARLFHQLQSQYRAVALVYPEIVVSYAEWEGRTAKWDGTTQGIDGKDEGILGFLNLLFTPEEERESGTVAALSLVVYTQSLEGENLYVHRAGIELINRHEDGQFVDVDAGILEDPQRRRRAVDVALEPLLDALRHRVEATITE